MSKLKRFFVPLVMFVFLTNCGDGSFDYDVTEAQRGPNFVQTSVNVTVPVEDIVVELPISATSLSTSDRNYEVEAVAGTGASSEYTLLGAVIPANQLEGVARVSFSFSNIADDNSRNVVLKMPNLEGAPSNEATITYFKEIVCNDVVVDIVPDAYPGETSWEITSQDDGSTVASGGSSGTTVNLPDGCYTFTIFDAFGDGICCGYGDGSYSVTCSIITHASGGSFGASESTDFCVNP